MEIDERAEPILHDNYPVFVSYWYLADGKPIRSDITGTVSQLKQDIRASEIRRCAAVKRGLL